MYLYGASVQGIQGFIFKTNKLQEIVGASEIVKGIEEEFRTFSNYEKEDKRILLNAAGNVKALFEDKESCKDVVKYFSKNIEQNAYGITLSQALVEISGKTPTKEEYRELDMKLKTQRNKPAIPLDMSLNIMQLNPATSKPVSQKEKKSKDELLLDKASQQKRDAFPDDEKFKELSDLSNGKNKIAVIHADGNGLGKLVPKLGDRLSSFSLALDEATRKAFEDAKTDGMKIREVILGGDDLTVICDANEALGFTKRYLENFEAYTVVLATLINKLIDDIENNKSSTKEERKTATELKEMNVKKLTACAGIAYTNEKYPFHYAVSLAKALCGQSKNHSSREASCLMFHNIQSSNFQTWGKFVDDELSIENDVYYGDISKAKNSHLEGAIRCDFGPYYLRGEKKPTIHDFLNSIGAYACEGSPISKLRNWLNELYKSSSYSEKILKRINVMAEQNSEWKSCIMDRNISKLYDGLSNDNLMVKKDFIKDENGVKKELTKTPIYDILQILSVTETK